MSFQFNFDVSVDEEQHLSGEDDNKGNPGKFVIVSGKIT